MFYCREGAIIKTCSTCRALYRADSLDLRSRQQKHTANRYAALNLS